jgi:anti-sigma regulatory factor (Ser/Thr protein kinase)
MAADDAAAASHGEVPIERLTLANEIDEVADAARWVERIAARWSLAADLEFRLQLCLEEAVSNVVYHAYPEAGRREILLSLGAYPDRLELTVEDDGVPFDPRTAAAPARPADLDQAPVGGLGIHLIRQFTRRLDYARVAERNRLTLEFAR